MKPGGKQSLEFQWTTQPYVPEDSTLHNHCCENLKYYNTKTFSLYALFCVIHLYLMLILEIICS
jgi:hypothetical protein